MPHYYFDTDPLLRWAESQATAPEDRSIRIGAEVSRLIEDSNNVNVISEITLAEFQNWLCILERSGEI